MTPDQGARLLQGLGMAARVIEVDKLERRVSELENALVSPGFSRHAGHANGAVGIKKTCVKISKPPGVMPTAGTPSAWSFPNDLSIAFRVCFLIWRLLLCCARGRLDTGRFG